MRNTSRSRQFDCNWTSRQSLANRRSRTGSRGSPSAAQISAASSGWALPLNTAISRTFARLASSKTADPGGHAPAGTHGLPVAQKVDNPVSYLGYCLRPGTAHLSGYPLYRDGANRLRLDPAWRAQPGIGAYGDMERQGPLATGDRGYDELLATEFVVRRAGQHQHGPPAALLMARHRIEVGEQHITGLVRHSVRLRRRRCIRASRP